MLVVAGEKLDKHRVRTCRIVTFDDFGDFFELGDDLAVHSSAFEVDSDICACPIAKDFRVDEIS